MLSFLSSLLPPVNRETSGPSHAKVLNLDKERRTEPERVASVWDKVLSRKSIGDFEGLEDRVAEIAQTEHYCFRGCQLALQNVLDKHFLTLHTLEFGKKESIGPDGKPAGDTSAYSFTSYLKSDRWLLNGRMGTGGTRAKISYENGPLSASLQGNFADDPSKNHMELDCTYNFRDMCIQLKSSDFVAYGICYTQPVTDTVGMGLEVYSTLDDRSRLKVVGQHTATDKQNQTILTWSTGLGPDQVTVSYLQKVNSHLSLLTSADFSFGADKQTKVKDWVSVLKVGYNYTCRDDGEQLPPNAFPPSIRACADSTGNISVFMEEPMSEALGLAISAKVNPITDDYDFGFGFTVSM